MYRIRPVRKTTGGCIRAVVRNTYHVGLPIPLQIQDIELTDLPVITLADRLQIQLVDDLPVSIIRFTSDAF